MQTLADRISYCRQAAGLSQRALGRVAGLSDHHIGQIEDGTYPSVHQKTAVKLAGVFNVTLDWLLSGRGKTPTKTHIQEAIRNATC